jgi:hypothetical protein
MTPEFEVTLYFHTVGHPGVATQHLTVSNGSIRQADAAVQAAAEAAARYLLTYDDWPQPPTIDPLPGSPDGSPPYRATVEEIGAPARTMTLDLGATPEPHS